MKISKRKANQLKNLEIKRLHEVEGYTFDEIGKMYSFSGTAAYLRYIKVKDLTNA